MSRPREVFLAEPSLKAELAPRSTVIASPFGRGAGAANTVAASVTRFGTSLRLADALHSIAVVCRSAVAIEDDGIGHKTAERRER
jgi:hypothetical protein